MILSIKLGSIVVGISFLLCLGAVVVRASESKLRGVCPAAVAEMTGRLVATGANFAFKSFDYFLILGAVFWPHNINIARHKMDSSSETGC